MNKIQALVLITISVLFNPINTSAEEIEGTGTEVFFESSHISGSGTRVNIQRAPVKIGGRLMHVNMVFEVGFQNGEVVFKKISSLDVSDIIRQASNFIPGIYKDGSGNLYTLSGPASTLENREVWTLVSNKQNFSLNWTTGAVLGHPTIRAHPDISSKDAEKLSNSLSYGMVSGNNDKDTDFDTNSVYWDDTGRLIGVQQIANTLSITLFTVDANILASITLTK